MKKIRWTADEIELVAAEVAAIQQKLPHGDLIAIDRAQKKVLPPERHRKHIATVSSGMRMAITRYKAELEKEKEEPPPPPARPEISIEEAILVILQHFTRLGDRIEKMHNRLMSLAVEQNGGLHWGTGPPVKPRVVIAGLLPDQVKAVANAFPDDIDIEPWNRNAGTQAQPDFMVLAKGFMGHDMENEIRKSGVKIVMAGRGTNSVIWAIQRGIKEL